MILIRIVGAFTLYWIVYRIFELWPIAGLLGVVAILVGIVVILAKAWMRKPQPLRSSGTAPIKSPNLPLRTATARSGMQPASIGSAIEQLPPTITKRSGSLFYSGPSAFEGQRPLYVLGLNPGGSPIDQADETVERDIADWQALTKPWSAYLDESWRGKPAGTHGMQPRIRHMFDQLRIDLREVPASNVVFVRSANEAALSAEKAELLSRCWPVHAAVIRELGIRTVLCLGTTAGRWTREAIGAHHLIDRFQERNDRGWSSEAHRVADGRVIVTVTHPSRADWRNPAADPTPLVRAVLAR